MTGTLALLVAGLGLAGALLAGVTPAARAREGNDPFADAPRRAGGVEVGVSAAYSPYEVTGMAVDGRGRPYAYRRRVEEARVDAVADVSVGRWAGLSLELSRILRWVQERRESADGTQALGWAQTRYTVAASLAVRAVETAREEVRLSCGVTHPPGIRMELRAGLVRDPVAMAGSLTVTAPPAGAPVSLSVALSVAFLANEAVTLGLWARHERPGSLPPGAARDGPLPTGVGFRAGYAPDEEGRREVGVRVGIVVLGAQARPSLALEYGATHP